MDKEIIFENYSEAYSNLIDYVRYAQEEKNFIPDHIVLEVEATYGDLDEIADKFNLNIPENRRMVLLRSDVDISVLDNADRFNSEVKKSLLMSKFPITKIDFKDYECMGTESLVYFENVHGTASATIYVYNKDESQVEVGLDAF